MGPRADAYADFAVSVMRSNHCKIMPLFMAARQSHVAVDRDTRAYLLSSRLAVRDARVALPNFYDVAVRIADVAARLAVFGLWFRDELGSSTFP